MIGGLGPTEIMLALLVVVLLFGGKKIPELMGGLARGIKSFKKAMNEPDAIDVTPEKPDEIAREDEEKESKKA
jgi:sec-independent protein translocase protein TatA